MADRYDDGVRGLRDHAVPDLWDEIQARAGRQAHGEAEPPSSDVAEGEVVSLTGVRKGQRRRWPVVAAAAAACLVIVLGGAVVLDRSEQAVTTTDPAATPDDGAQTTVQSPETTDPSVRADPPTTTAEIEPDEGRPEPPVGEDEAPHTTSSGTGSAVAGCDELELASSSVPEDLDRVQQPPTPGDSRLHEAARPHLIGVFDSTASSDRAVFVIDARGFGEDGGRYIQHPSFGEVWLAHSGDRGLAEPTIGLNDQLCELTLWSIGLTEPELEELVLGLQLAH